MKTIRKTTISFLLVLLVSLFLNVALVASSANETTIYGTSYYVEEVADSKDLGFGVTYHRDIAYTRLNQEGLCVSSDTGFGSSTPVEINKWYKQQVNVLELSTNENVRIVPWSIQAGSNWSVTTVRKFAADFEEKNPGYKVIAGINGDFFKTSTPYSSTGVTVSEGEFLKAKSSHSSTGHTLGFKNDGNGSQIVDIESLNIKPTLTIYNDADEIILKIDVDKVNQEPQGNEVSLYYSQRANDYDANIIKQSVPGKAWHVSKPDVGVTLMVDSYYGKGTIDAYQEEAFELISGQFAIITNNENVNNYLKLGTTVRAQYEFTSSEAEGIQNFIGYPCGILKNATYSGGDGNFSKERHPRTMIGQKADGTIVMSVIDGRQASLGMYGGTIYELATIMTHYGCVDAWNLDGGGSSTMIVRKQDNWDFTNDFVSTNTSEWHVVNSPSDGGERTDGNCLLIAIKVPVMEIESQIITPSSLTVKVNVVEMMTEYQDLYISINDQKKKLVDGIAEFKSLSIHTSYVCKIYALVDGEYVDLMTTKTLTTAYMEVVLDRLLFGVTTVNKEQMININYLFNNNDPILKATITIDGVEYVSIRGKIQLPYTYETIKNCNNIQIEVLYDLEDGKGRLTKSFSCDEIEVTLSFLLSEIKLTVNGISEEMMY